MSDFLFQRYFDGGGEATGVGSYPKTETGVVGGKAEPGSIGIMPIAELFGSEGKGDRSGLAGGNEDFLETLEFANGSRQFSG